MPTPIETTLNRELANWDLIYWVSRSLSRNLLFLRQATNEFRNQGGSLFVNAPITYGADPPVEVQHQDEIFSLLPFNCFETHPDGERFRLDRLGGEGREVISVFEDDDVGDLTLQLDTGIGNLVPLTIGGESEALYEADYIDSEDYDYSRLVSTVDAGNDPGILYFGIRLTDFTDDSPVAETVEYFINERLGF